MNYSKEQEDILKESIHQFNSNFENNYHENKNYNSSVSYFKKLAKLIKEKKEEKLPSNYCQLATYETYKNMHAWDNKLKLMDITAAKKELGIAANKQFPRVCGRCCRLKIESHYCVKNNLTKFSHTQWIFKGISVCDLNVIMAATHGKEIKEENGKVVLAPHTADQCIGWAKAHKLTKEQKNNMKKHRQLEARKTVANTIKRIDEEKDSLEVEKENDEEDQTTSLEYAETSQNLIPERYFSQNIKHNHYLDELPLVFTQPIQRSDSEEQTVEKTNKRKNQFEEHTNGKIHQERKRKSEQKMHPKPNLSDVVPDVSIAVTSVFSPPGNLSANELINIISKLERMNVSFSFENGKIILKSQENTLVYQWEFAKKMLIELNFVNIH